MYIWYYFFKSSKTWQKLSLVSPESYRPTEENKSFIPHDKLHKDKHSTAQIVFLSNSLSQIMFFWFSSKLFNLSCKKQSLIELSRQKKKKVMVLGRGGWRKRIRQNENGWVLYGLSQDHSASPQFSRLRTCVFLKKTLPRYKF